MKGWKGSTVLPMREDGPAGWLRLARSIRLWSIAGATGSLVASLVLETAVTMAMLAVVFFFTYMFATQWRERLTEPVL